MKASCEDLLNYPICTLSHKDCITDIVSWIEQASRDTPCGWLACLNPHSYVAALDDPRFAQALSMADWLIPDGAGIVLASKLLGGRISDRITGSDIFSGLHEALNRRSGYRVFFLGSTEECLADVLTRMAKDYPNIKVAGTFSPPFKAEFSAEENRQMIAAIRSAAPDVLWVGMTAPKQEKWIYLHKDELNVKFAAAIGAVFDFYTGRVKRSHPVFQRLGLEWLPRLLQQPRRLWRRMFLSAPIFVWHVIRHRFGIPIGLRHNK